MISDHPSGVEADISLAPRIRAGEPSIPNSISPELLQGLFSICSVACLPLGLLWDISWHVSIGRDTFWQPAHIAIQLGGIVPALIFAWQAFHVTFRGTEEERGAAISFWGARASFGAWIAIWGALTMVTSAPFDDWWHNTYGLDVKIASPPHAILGLGMFAVLLGVSLFVLALQNRLNGRQQRFAARLFLFACGLVVTLFSTYATEYSWPNKQHTANFYKVIAWVFPFVFALIARASKSPWAATKSALIYLVFLSAFIWILPLFHAQPKLAPIYNPVDHMVPPPFPMLLFLPALSIDLWMLLLNRERPNGRESNTTSVSLGVRFRDWLREWGLAALLGISFVLLALAVQWPFAKFLLSPTADNWFFAGGRHWPYYVQPGPWIQQFWDQDRDPMTWQGFFRALLFSVISARAGLWAGRWMMKVQR